MDYVWKLLAQSWNDTWEFVLGVPARAIIVGFLVFGVTLFLHWKRKGIDDMKEALFGGMEGALATIVILVIAFLFHLLFLSPKHLVDAANSIALTEEQKAAAAIASAHSAPIKFDTADYELRKQVKGLQEENSTLSSELSKAKQQVQTQNSELNELKKSIGDRSLNSAQKAALIDKLKVLPKGTIFVRSNLMDGEAEQFAAELTEVLKSAGYSILQAYSEMISVNQPGVFMLVANPEDPPNHAVPLYNAFKEVGIPIKGQEAPASSQQLRGLDIKSPRNLASDEIIIWVSRKQ